MRIIYLSSIFTFILASNAFAYLDPNSGGGVIAFLVAILAGIAFYAKKIFYGIRNIFKKGGSENTAADDEKEQDK